MSIRKYKPFINVGPGDIIKREMEYLGWTQEDLAEIMGLTTKSINQILNHKQAVTMDSAILLSKAIGPSPESWMNLERNYRLRLREDSEKNKGEEQETETKAKIRKYMPLANMRKKRWIDYDRSAESQEEAFKGFWAKDSLDFSMYNEEELPLYARRSLQSDPEYTRYYTQTWLRKARMEADTLIADPYDADTLRNLARDIPSLTRREDGIPYIIEGLGAAGVKFFVLSHLEKTYLDGASFLSGNHPVVVYTGRYKNLDSFWWTVSHEIAHVLLHLKDADDYFLDDLKDSPDEDELEIQANDFCREVFGVKALLKAAIPYRNYFTRKRLFELAERFGMEASIILGILQFEGMVPYRTRLNDLKSSAVERLPEGVVKG